MGNAQAIHAERNTFFIGLIIAFSSWALIFITLIWAYLVFRMHSPVWMTPILSGPIQWLAAANTIVIGASSYALNAGLRSQKKNWVSASMLLGMCFLCGQIALWHDVLMQCVNWHSNHAESFLFLLTGFHALHIVGGLIAIGYLWIKWAELGHSLKATAIKIFWDSLFYIWLVMFVLIFIIQ